MLRALLVLPLTLTPTPTTDTVHIESVYVAGISSGGYMADQLHVANSATIDGAAIFSAGAYHCARGNLVTAQLACMNDIYDDNPTELEQIARDRAATGQIDAIDNLADNPVWIYHGRNDSTVKESVTAGMAELYTALDADVSYHDDSTAGHAWISPLGPNGCETSAPPYINDCGDDPQGDMLGHLYGSVTAPATTPSGTLDTFDQNPFAPNGNAAAISMGATGYRYTPTSCTDGASCRLLVALHGCKQSADAIGTTLVENAHLNEYADTNNTIVLYPQATTSSDNPNGCWNWWGYGGDADYDTRSGDQIQTLMNMITTA